MTFKTETKNQNFQYELERVYECLDQLDKTRATRKRASKKENLTKERFVFFVFLSPKHFIHLKRNHCGVLIAK